jgi:uncharacterized membrane protein YuzA (DUF378 family)
MMNGHKCNVAKCCWWLVVVGAVNWGLVGVGAFVGQNWNVVNLVLGSWPQVEWVAYVLIGLAGVMSLVGCRCKTCKGG